MALSDICDHGDIRLNHFRKSCHLSEIADPHFNNGSLMLFTYAKERERYTDLVIIISLSFQDIVFLR